jgi:hypothetical protein
MRIPPLLTALLCCCVLFSHSAQAGAKKRTRYVELQAMGGYSWLNLTGFSQDHFIAALPNAVASGDQDAAVAASQVPVRGQGPSGGLAAQLKLWVFVLGARYAATNAEDFNLHTVGADLGMRLGDRVAVYGRAGGGLAFLTGLPPELETRGFMVSLSGGLEIMLADPISLGFGLDGDLLLLSQEIGSAADLASGNADAQDLANLDGSAAGFQLRPQLHLTWHL